MTPEEKAANYNDTALNTPIVPLPLLSPTAQDVSSKAKAREMNTLADRFIDPRSLGEQVGETVEGVYDAAIGGATAVLGLTGDAIAYPTALLYNLGKMAAGESFDWPDNFNDVPATGDYYGHLAGADTESLAFMGGAMALDPKKAAKGAVQFSSKVLQSAKALAGGKASALARSVEAEDLYKAGKLNDDEIWKLTGWKKSANGKLGFHISDKDAKLNLGNLQGKIDQSPTVTIDGEELKNVTLRADEVLNHDALFELYPELAGRNVTVTMRSYETAKGTAWRPYHGANGQRGSYNPATHNIKITNRDARSSILHELQHAVSEAEDFSRGAGADVYMRSIDDLAYARAVKDIAANPVTYLVPDLADLRVLITENNPALSKKAVNGVMKQADSILNFADDEMQLNQIVVEMMVAESHASSASRRWLEQLFIETPDEVGRMMKEMDPNVLAMLSRQRYRNAGGEVDARIVQAMRHVPQEVIDNLPTEPVKQQRNFGMVSQELTGTVAVPGSKPMVDPVAADRIVP